MDPLPAIRWPSTPNGGFDPFATPGSDPKATFVVARSGRSRSESCGADRPSHQSMVRDFGHSANSIDSKAGSMGRSRSSINSSFLKDCFSSALGAWNAYLVLRYIGRPLVMSAARTIT